MLGDPVMNIAAKRNEKMIALRIPDQMIAFRVLVSRVPHFGQINLRVAHWAQKKLLSLLHQFASLAEKLEKSFLHFGQDRFTTSLEKLFRIKILSGNPVVYPLLFLN
ncbi:MAG: hypothetical protein QW531_03735 [Thermoplasmata archaeon]